MSNAEICERIDSSDEWIRRRSGISTRRWAGADETVADMGVQAGSRALTTAGLEGGSVDTLLVSTVTHPYQTPAAAPEIAERLGMRSVPAFDVSAACAGFGYCVALADCAIRAGDAQCVMVVAAEKLTDITDPDDRTSAFLFADGAGAVVVSATSAPGHYGIGPVAWGSDGSRLSVVGQQPSWAAFHPDNPGPRPALRMRGQELYRWAVSELTKVCTRAVTAAGVDLSELSAFIPHQANARITDALAKALGIPGHVVCAHDIEHSGNTSSASIPLAMEHLLSTGAVRSGDLALLLGFGAGLTYAALVVELP
nr:3-oxoacyl-ACP synthase [Streptomyces tsukubensis NRRL18488]